MKNGYVVLGLFGALLASPSAQADCHDRRYAAKPDPCSKLVELYAAALSADSGQLDPLLAGDVQLTVKGPPAKTITQRKDVLDWFQKDFEQRGHATYTHGPLDGGHLKVGGFLGFGGKKLDNVAVLRWKGTITPTGKTPTVEHVTAILLKTKPGQDRPWQFLTLHIKRQRVRPQPPASLSALAASSR